jgi:L-threonylcarbamoyladenylate synthase
LVAFPTESFYGLAANIADEKALQRLFAAKKRRGGIPILILIPSLETLSQYVTYIPETGRQLIKEFWPGGLTLIFEAGANISPLLTGRTGKIGIRYSSHPVATALSRAVGMPITGTSANVSGQPACLNAKAVSHSLGNAVDLILDGGETEGAMGSTVLDITIKPPRVLRQGMVSREKLSKYLE